MSQASKMLRIIRFAMLYSIAMYAVVGELVPHRGLPTNPAFAYVLTTFGVAIVGMIFVVRRTLVLRAAQSLLDNPNDPLSLNHWKTGYIATYALCEAFALFGLVLRLLGFGVQQSVTFYFGGFLLLAFFSPRRPGAVLA